MRLTEVLFLIATSTVLAGSVTVKSLVFQSESVTNYVEMIPQKPLNLEAFTLCMRVATELPTEQREIILFAYRTQYYDELNVWRELDGRLSFYLSGEGVFFKAPKLGAMETHLCFTWDSSSGAANVFVDGKKSITKIYKKGHAVRSGGKVILGQDPDNYFGDFEAGQSFVGEITEVNMWDNVLSGKAIRTLYAGGRATTPNVFDWENTELRIQGEVGVVTREL
ncbi:pentraxin fusion protein-like [Notolabrus celidotus]|uniref:pentraxin fusion protein-like n=1 Tax=Notolabrus celidotus TaxID=1203425 RepID=UPI00148F50EA|nr:pentraxin fusion protein-like [Notolabrus celidotus]